MTYRAFAFATVNGYVHGYAGNGWRFSAARSVTAAISGRAVVDGELHPRCPLNDSLNTES